jgi:hypothetical protein
MPDKDDAEALARAHADADEGKSPSTQAGEFVREEIDHIREGKHGARSTKQAIAIGLSKARRAGIRLGAPARGKTSARTRRQAQRDLKKGGQKNRRVSPRRSRAAAKALKREPRSSASPAALSRQARSSARKRTVRQRSAAAQRAAQTRGAVRRSAAARKAARTRGRR